MNAVVTTHAGALAEPIAQALSARFSVTLAREIEACPAACDAWVIHPDVAPALPLRLVNGLLPLRSLRLAERAIEDDACWDAAVKGGVEMPWRWLEAALARGARSITLLIPGHGPLSTPEASACREALVAMVQVARVVPRARINAVQLREGVDPIALASTVAFLASDDARAISGQILSI